MRFKPILIFTGEPNSIFSEILIKSINKIKIKKPIIVISSKKLLIKQLKKLNFKKKIRLLNYKNLKNYHLNNKSINLIDIDYNQQKAFEKKSGKSKTRIHFFTNWVHMGGVEVSRPPSDAEIRSASV